VLSTEKLNKILLNVPKKVYLGLFLFFLLIDAVGLNLAQLLKKIEIFDIAAAYNSLTNLYPPITKIAQDYIYVFLVLTGISFALLFYRPKLILLKHISFAFDIAAVNPNVLKNHRVKNIDVNQYEAMRNIYTFIRAISDQDRTAELIMRSRKSASLCYYGIAHTPLIFRLGFLLGDQNNIMLLHKARTNGSLFDEWSDDNNGYSTITSNESNKSVSSTELIVSISTSLKITEQDLVSLKPANKHVLNFVSNVISFDSIMSYSQAENFRSAIMYGIRECVKKHGIQKIHMVISSSVVFTFFLGQALSAQHDPITVVYHFEKSTYPWGVCMNEKAEKALVINHMADSTI